MGKNTGKQKILEEKFKKLKKELSEKEDETGADQLPQGLPDRDFKRNLGCG